jgi:hypothetical protein
MTQVHFTLERKKIQSLIEKSTKKDAAKTIIIEIFHYKLDSV